MEPDTEAQLDVSMASGTHPRKHIRYNTQVWNSHRPLIERLYLDEDKPLSKIMTLLENDHDFRPCPRTFKARIQKEWGLRKNIPARDMAVVVAKTEKRKHVEGKETVIFVDGRPLGQQRMEHFKKRKSAKDTVASPSAPTPPYIVFGTPELKYQTLGTSSSPTETAAWAASFAGVDIALFNETTDGVQDGKYSWGQEPVSYNDQSLADKGSTWSANQYIAEQEMPRYMGSSSPEPNPWNRRPEPQTFLPFHKWGLQDGFMAIFEAGDDFTGFSSFRVPLLMSASSRKAAFELIDDQIQDIQKLVFCLERIQPWMLEKSNKITPYLDPTITMRACNFIDRVMEHIKLVLQQPLFPKDDTDGCGKLWPGLGILLDEDSKTILWFAGMLITKYQEQWRTFREIFLNFPRSNKIPTTLLIPVPIVAKLTSLEANMAGHFVFGLHSFLPMIGVICTRLLILSDELASDKKSFIQAIRSFARGIIDWIERLSLYFSPERSLIGEMLAAYPAS